MILRAMLTLLLLGITSAAATRRKDCNCQMPQWNTAHSIQHSQQHIHDSLNNSFSLQQLSLQIHVFTPMMRSNQFDLLFQSINNANKIHDDDDRFSVSLVIHVDSFVSKLDSKKFLRYLKSLSFRHGRVLLSISANRVNSTSSSRFHERDASNLWMPTNDNEFAIFLSSPTIHSVSRHFLEFAEQTVKHYFYSTNKSLTNSLMAISLLSHIENHTDTVVGPYLLQYPHEYGMILSPTLWFEFINWKIALPIWIDPFIPDSKTNAWPADSWIKALLRFMSQYGKTILYPNFPSHASLVKTESGKLLEEIVESQDWLISERNRKVFRLGHPYISSLSTLPAYDMYFQKLGDGQARTLGDSVQSFDGCSMIMQVYSRASTILDRLKYYHTMPLLTSMIIVWNNLNATPPHINHPLTPPSSRNLKSPTFAIPIHILKQPFNSMNNRFLPFHEYTSNTSCHIAMDDDWDFSHAKLISAVRVWQRNGFNRLVGFHQQGRVHVKRGGDDNVLKTLKDLKVGDNSYNGGAGGNDNNTTTAMLSKTAVHFKFGYAKNTRKAISILMPSATIYHSKYHDMYTHDLPQRARAIVQELTNCDDILFNMMVANATGAGPVVLEDGLKIEKPIVFEVGDGGGGGKDGLWKDNEHWGKRAWCMNYFVEHVFGGRMPLKETRVFKDGSNNKKKKTRK
ncbi:glycosyl transferase family 64 domain-containing protein [Obelidium mucronatum]|nr:glycosyl transferase family 64 domain-containing protein [Obelidium mucronatum]